MVSAEQFVDGASVKWVALATTIFGGAFLGFFDGLISAILALGSTIGGLWSGLGEFLGDFVTAWLAAPIAAMQTAWDALRAAAGSAGIFGFVGVALGIVLILYSVAWGVRQFAGN